jgi:hypothetical protein
MPLQKRLLGIFAAAGASIILGIVMLYGNYLAPDTQTGNSERGLTPAEAARPAFLSETKAIVKEGKNVQIQMTRPSIIKAGQETEFELLFTTSEGYKFLENIAYNVKVVQGNKIVYEATGISLDGSESITPLFEKGAARVYLSVAMNGDVTSLESTEQIIPAGNNADIAAFDIAQTN